MKKLWEIRYAVNLWLVKYKLNKVRYTVKSPAKQKKQKHVGYMRVVRASPQTKIKYLKFILRNTVLNRRNLFRRKHNQWLNLSFQCKRIEATPDL